MTPHELIEGYFKLGLQLVQWPMNGDNKGPQEKDWPHHPLQSPADYIEGHRVGLLCGVEISPGHFYADVDLDWQPGSAIAQTLLPITGFAYGHYSKNPSHLGYTIPERVPSVKYLDIDNKTTYFEIRCAKNDLSIGLQSMAPPSIWSKNGLQEPLAFLKYHAPTHIDPWSQLKRRSDLTAIAMLLAHHLGINGFGHDARLAFAGTLLRLGVTVDECVAIGEVISGYCNNREVHDVRRAVQSTADALESKKKHTKGGPALAKLLGANGKAVVARINEWLGKDADFARDQNGRIYPKSQENIKRAVELLNHQLSYNEFTDQLLLDGQPLEDRTAIPLLLEIDREYRFQPPDQYFDKVIKDLAWQNSFHPVKQYLDGLTWDQTPRVDTWLITAAKAEDSPYVRAISAIMLIAAVRRIRSPGCKYDEMVVWESPQGSLKSSAVQALCHDPAWFSDDLKLNLHSQQLIEATLGRWLIEASELSGKRKAEIESLKAMLSRQVDGPARMAYAHFPISRPRHFILLGTTNSTAYLNDATGNRRFWPMTVQTFNIEWITKWRDQLWGEACEREKTGESIRLPEALWPEAAEQQEQRRQDDPWEEILRLFLLKEPPDSDGLVRVTANRLWDALNIASSDRDRSGQNRLSEIMQRFGFKRQNVRPLLVVLENGQPKTTKGEAEKGYVGNANVLDVVPF